MNAVSRKNKVDGFTLLEAVIVILLLGITTTSVIQLNNGLFHGSNFSRNVQFNTQLLQACAERIMASRRLSGYSEIFGYYDDLCESLPFGPAGTDRFTVTAKPASDSICPTGSTCQVLEISVNESIGSVGSLSLQLMKY